jgi:HEAT repeat protein
MRADPDDEVTRRLESVLVRKDPTELREILLGAASGGLSARWATVLARLLMELWHHQHEDIANALQDLRDPATVDALYEVTNNSAPFSAVDDGRALARKCIWALHDIGTPAAVDKLELLTTTTDVETRERAAKKLADLRSRAPGAPPMPYRIRRDRGVRR